MKVWELVYVNTVGVERTTHIEGSANEIDKLASYLMFLGFRFIMYRPVGFVVMVEGRCVCGTC